MMRVNVVLFALDRSEARSAAKDSNLPLELWFEIICRE
jgi:hypothetical protein